MSTISFKEQIERDIIPRVLKMAEKEKEHLTWLISNNGSKNMIEVSKSYIAHFEEKYKEYSEHLKTLKDDKIT